MGGVSSVSQVLPSNVLTTHTTCNVIFIHRFSEPPPKGFSREGGSVHFSANKEDTIKDVLNKFNEYRAPNDKLRYLYDRDGIEYRPTDSITLSKVYYV